MLYSGDDVVFAPSRQLIWGNSRKDLRILVLLAGSWPKNQCHMLNIVGKSTNTSAAWGRGGRHEG